MAGFGINLMRILGYGVRFDRFAACSGVVGFYRFASDIAGKECLFVPFILEFVMN